MPRGTTPSAVVPGCWFRDPEVPGLGAWSSSSAPGGCRSARVSGLRCVPSSPWRRESGLPSSWPLRSRGCDPCPSESAGPGESGADDEEDVEADEEDESDDDAASSSESVVCRGPVHGKRRGRPVGCSRPRQPARALFHSSAESHAFPGSAGLMSAELSMVVAPPLFLPAAGIQTT